MSRYDIIYGYGGRLADADPVIQGLDYLRGDMTLVSYLRASFRFGGFPGFEFRPPAPALVAELSRGLLPF